ncbi:hypothetical protein TH53_04335 [Pedobacter lusitanus]|uniref:Uncharacterized protein n=1 Tax=Pedobacter lusitanus TaxID=1503925 RepID=A0A0D0GV10_9SPHI|nr:hypothetical protein [Pedobacter lusitanus]KIO78251.1 hypothetical protein TH53_04335 [Pedobacter lusitanus]
MKKHQLSLITILLLPLSTFAQSSYTSENIIFGIIVIIIIAFLFSLAIREVLTWYWKINDLLKNQVTQIRLQTETNNLLSKQLTLTKSQAELIIEPEKTTAEINNN